MIYFSAVLLLTGRSIFPFPIDTNPLISARSQQWAGYVARSSVLVPQPEVTGVSASWTVPTIEATVNDTFSGIWIGIGGFGENTLIQTGTLQQCTNGRVAYYAWYELLPALTVRITDLSVTPGDTISASINHVDGTGNSWSVEINDVTRGESYRRTFVYNSSRLSAEWVVERPTVSSRISTLPDFGNVTFFESTATIGNHTSTISGFPRYKLDMYTSGNVQLANASSLSSDGSSFTVYSQSPQSTRSQASVNSTLTNAALFSSFLVCPRSENSSSQSKCNFPRRNYF